MRRKRKAITGKTTIWVSEETKDKLNKLKRPGESIDELLRRLLALLGH